MDVNDIRKLLAAVANHEIDELTLETGDYKLSVRRGTEPTSAVQPAVQPAAPAAAPQPQPAPGAASVAVAPTPAAAAGAPTSEPAQAPSEDTSRLHEVTAPIVGTFYSAPAPDADPYVKVGDKVEKGAVLCIIEAMKLMNEIEAEAAGTVAEVLVRNEDPVEYGQVLFRIDPA